VIALAVAGGLCLGGYVLYQDGSQLPGPLKHIAEIATARPADFARIASPAQALPRPVPPAEARPEAFPLDVKVIQTVSIQPPPAVEKQETASVQPDAIVPVAVTQPVEADNTPAAAVGPPLEIAPGDPRVFRERGIFAYRSGDLDGAVAEFDHAIQLDPKFSAAYIDRGIVLYRLQRFERAFADIAQAKRIERFNRSRAALSAPAAPGKKPKPQAAVAPGPPPFFQRRTAKLD
jgi:tetratricopeptide (TPR) repeat protein